jgi:aminoglycoside phosphotransferase (APT) family kinase protein
MAPFSANYSARLPLRIMPPEDPELRTFVDRLGMAGPQVWTPLSGGVSCHVWRVEAGGRTIVVKQALGKLAVADDWRAPVSRALHEFRWFETARALVPGSAPEPLAVDPERGLIAMAWLADSDHSLWKPRLLAGEIDTAVARSVGDRLAAIHAASARLPVLAGRFATDEAFFALRLDAYLLTAARRRPAVADALRALVERTAATRIALVHGDVSPKNIMMGPEGPVFLDAETAWWGDPAFDLAFCLNHLLLKTLVVPDADTALLLAFDALARAYLGKVNWEAPAALGGRAASLLPGLLLARVDGKSPVEYLTLEAQKDFVRGVAGPLLLDPPATLWAVRETWRRALDSVKA